MADCSASYGTKCSAAKVYSIIVLSNILINNTIYSPLWLNVDMFKIYRDCVYSASNLLYSRLLGVMKSDVVRTENCEVTLDGRFFPFYVKLVWLLLSVTIGALPCLYEPLYIGTRLILINIILKIKTNAWITYITKILTVNRKKQLLAYFGAFSCSIQVRYFSESCLVHVCYL